MLIIKPVFSEGEQEYLVLFEDSSRELVSEKILAEILLGRKVDMVKWAA